MANIYCSLISKQCARNVCLPLGAFFPVLICFAWQARVCVWSTQLDNPLERVGGRRCWGRGNEVVTLVKLHAICSAITNVARGATSTRLSCDTNSLSKFAVEFIFGAGQFRVLELVVGSVVWWYIEQQLPRPCVKEKLRYCAHTCECTERKASCACVESDFSWVTF